MNYKVFATLEMRAGGAVAGANRVASAVDRLQARLRGTQGAVGNLTRNLVGMAAGVVGLHAITHATRSAIGSTIAYSAELERMKIGLAAVMSQVEGTTFAVGVERAAVVFEHMRTASITSTATAAEMMNIFQQIAGPLRQAGAEISTIEGITRSTVSASSALGVDFQQAARDIQMMSRGVAGTDVKLFSLLRSTGAIVESTEEWNEGLTAAERVTKIQEALARFDQSAEAAGQSWSGVTSTFRGMIDELKRAFGGPMFEEMKKFIGKINSLLIGNQDGLFSSLEDAGAQAAEKLAKVLDWAYLKVEYLVTHWDEIVSRIKEVATYIQSITPTIIKFAKAAAILSAAKSVAATGLGVVGAGANLVGMAGGAANAVGGLGAMLGVSTLGGAAAATTTVAGTGAAAGLGGIGSAMGAAGASALGLSGPVGVLGTAFAAMFSPVTLLVVALLSIVGVFVALANNSSKFASMWAETAGPALGELWESLKKLYHALEPLLEALGGAVLGVVIKTIEIFATVLGFIVDVVSEVIEAISNLISWLWDLIAASDPDGGLAKASAVDRTNASLLDGDPLSSPLNEQALAGLMGESFVPESLRRADGRNATSTRNVHINRMNVNQEFRQSDPDRILTTLIDDIEREADQRIGSGFAPLFSG